MSQSVDVLFRARQGDPVAIARLINTRLEPQDISATVEQIGDRLLIIYHSSHDLPASSLVRFSQNGVQGLGLQTINTVQIMGCKTGCNRPLWQTEFQLHAFSSGRAAVSHFQPSPLPPQIVEPPLTPASHQPLAKKDPSKQSSCRPPARLNQPINLSQPRYFLPTSGMILTGFLLGGVVALLTNLSTANTAMVVQPMSSSTESVLPPPAYRLWQQQQAIIRYLRRMNEAQQEFYQQNGRFALNLEELERFASVISHSQGYTIKLISQSRQQALITATAKIEGLKSYTAIAHRSALPSSLSWQIKVCETQQPARVAPAIAKDSLQCPVNAVWLPFPPTGWDRDP
jgi:hypothetical protein